MTIQFPTVTGSNLQRRKLTFPADLTSELTITLIAFQQWQQRLIDTWLPEAERLEQQYPGLSYYELPVIRKMNILSRTFINEGMRAGIPNTKARERTVTFYTDKRNFKESLGIIGESTIHVLLVDKQGHVLWRIEGEFSPEKGSALELAIQNELVTNS